MVCTFIDMLCKYTNLHYTELLMLLVGGWLRWPGDYSWSRQTALLLVRLLGVLLFTEARSMGRAVQWSQRVSWSGWYPLKCSLTCSIRWLHCDLQNVLCEQANCTAGTVRVNWSEASSWLTDWTELRRLYNCLEVDPNGNTARNNTCCVCWLPWKVLFIRLLLGYRFA
jgi:hypothetical protein